MSKSVRNILIAVGALVIVITAAIPIAMLLRPGTIDPGNDSSTPTYDSNTTTTPWQPPETDPTEPDDSALLGESESHSEDGQTTGYPTQNNPPTYPAANPTTRAAAAPRPTTTRPTTARPTTAVPTTKPTTKVPTTTKPPSTQDLFGQMVEAHGEPEDGRSLLSYKMDPNEGYFYTETNAWQRNFGFNAIYDTMAPVTVMFYDTVRIKFTYAYPGSESLDWMIQMWKGQYGFLFLGAEIGVYHKPEGRSNGGNIEHYDCATDANMLGMEIRMYNKGEVAFRRPYKLYWWVTGFVSGKLDKYADRSQLMVEARITFKDNNMARLFADGLDAAGFEKVSKLDIAQWDTYVQNGKDVLFVWKYIKQSLNGK